MPNTLAVVLAVMLLILFLSVRDRGKKCVPMDIEPSTYCPGSAPPSRHIILYIQHKVVFRNPEHSHSVETACFCLKENQRVSL